LWLCKIQCCLTVGLQLGAAIGRQTRQLALSPSWLLVVLLLGGGDSRGGPLLGMLMLLPKRVLVRQPLPIQSEPVIHTPRKREPVIHTPRKRAKALHPAMLEGMAALVR